MKYSKLEKKVNKKCNGCGIWLTNDETKLGYTPILEKASLCQRCFKLKHYNYDSLLENKNINIESHVADILSKFDFSDKFTFYVCSIAQLPFCKKDIKILQKKSKVFYLVISKFDLLTGIFKKELAYNKLVNLIKKTGININEDKIIICSATKNINFLNLNEKLLKAFKQKNKVAFCGPTNAGKSSIINWILNKYEVNNVNKLTTSYYKNTTQDIKQVKIFNYGSIIDLPGIIDKNSFQTLINEDKLKKFYGSKAKWKSKVFQLWNNRIFNLDNLMIIECFVDQNNKKNLKSIVTYFNQDMSIYGKNNTNLLKTKNKINKNLWAKYEYDLNKEFNTLFLNNLGFIVLKNIQKINVFIPKNVSKPLLIRNNKF